MMVDDWGLNFDASGYVSSKSIQSLSGNPDLTAHLKLHQGLLQSSHVGNGQFPISFTISGQLGKSPFADDFQTFVGKTHISG